MNAKEMFPALMDLIQDKKFMEFLKIRISDIEGHRTKALSTAPKGATIVKGPYDYLKERGVMNPESIRQELILISGKSSKMPLSVREYVDFHCSLAIHKTIRFYNEIDEKEKKEAMLKARADYQAKRKETRKLKTNKHK